MEVETRMDGKPLSATEPEECGFGGASVESELESEVATSASAVAEGEEEKEMTVNQKGSGGGGGDAASGKGKGCPHVGKGFSMPGIRKALKNDIQVVCSKSTCEAYNATQWMCLQCGHFGCGDEKGIGGHAKIHVRTPRSDCHALAIQMSGNLDKIWCFECQTEMDGTQSELKDGVNFIRRHPKVKGAFNQPTTQSAHPPIVLGPPPPPPPPAMKNDPPKILGSNFVKGKNAANRMAGSSSSGNSKWDRDGSGGSDWPMGLENLGNTCFMNSALQCLSRTRFLLDKLDLYGNGNTIEILVTPEEPCVRIVNPNVVDDDENDISDEPDSRFILSSGTESSQPSTSADSSCEISPSSTEIDSLLDAASTRSSRKSECEPPTGEESEQDLIKRELKKELDKELKLRLHMTRDSMSTKLRQCFRAITKSNDTSPDSEDTGYSGSYSRNVYSPRSIQFAVSRHFRLGQQHDSHELLRTVVDMMKKDQIKSFRLAIMHRYGVKRHEGKTCDPRLTELLKMWDRRLYHKTFVDEIFGGELVTFQECWQCRNVKRSHEDFLDLSLPIRVFRSNPNPNPSTKKTYSLYDDDHDYAINRSVEECLSAYTAPEFLTGSNVVECENCHRINLERLAQGEQFEDVFPGINLDNKAADKASGGNQKLSKHQQKKQNKAMKRQNRQAKINARSKGHQADPQLNLVENHFETEGYDNEKSETEEDCKTNKIGEDFVVIHSVPSESKKQENHVSMDIEDSGMESTQGKNEESRLINMKKLTLIEDGMDTEDGLLAEHDHDPEEENHIGNSENLDEFMDDLDEPAVDGIGNASDIEDEDSNDPIPGSLLDLGLEDKPISVSDYLAVPVADEGFSEGENSSEEKPSQSLSGSSSHNSISEADPVVEPDEDRVKEKKIPVTKCPCSRRQLISRAPECLTLHLKRFQHTARGSSKLGDKVTFPYILNLTQFCSEEGEDTTKPGFKSTFDEDGEVVYSLYGIVEHSGSLHFGHYVAYVKVDGKGEEDTWYYISDSHVSRTTLKQVLIQDAYILFYERIRGPEKKKKVLQSIEKLQDLDQDPWVNPGLKTYSNKPATTTTINASASWEEKWDNDNEDSSSNQQVSSTNDTQNEDMSITLNYEPDPVSSSTVYGSGHLSQDPSLDGVSSTTADSDTMDCSSLLASSASSVLNSPHEIWASHSQEIIGQSDFLGENMDEGVSGSGIGNPVSSSSDIMSPNSEDCGKLEEVD